MSQAQLVLKKLKQVTFICIVFIILEILGGVLAHSIAIISDALHLFSDVIAFILSGFAVWLSTQTPPSWLAFGYHKIQSLGALLNVIIIYIVTIYLFIEATERIIKKEVVENPLYMLITSVFGLGCNLVMMKILHSSDSTIPHHCCDHQHGKRHRKGSGDQLHKASEIKDISLSESTPQSSSNQMSYMSIHETLNIPSFDMIHSHEYPCSHDHEHDHSSSSQQPAANKIFPSSHTLSQPNLPPSKHNDIHENLNIQAAYAHILGDIILSIGVAFAATIIFLFTKQGEPYSLVHLADPICTYLFSVLVLIVTLPVLKRSLIVLLDGSLHADLALKLRTELEKAKIQNFQNIKIWSISVNQHIGSLSLNDNYEKQQIFVIKKLFKQHNVKLFIQV